MRQHLWVICAIKRINIVWWNVANRSFLRLTSCLVKHEHWEAFTIKHVYLITKLLCSKCISNYSLVTGIRIDSTSQVACNHALQLHLVAIAATCNIFTSFDMTESSFIVKSLLAARTREQNAFQYFLDWMMKIFSFWTIAIFLGAWKFLENFNAFVTVQIITICALTRKRRYHMHAKTACKHLHTSWQGWRHIYISGLGSK